MRARMLGSCAAIKMLAQLDALGYDLRQVPHALVDEVDGDFKLFFLIPCFLLIHIV